jgi:uncharacterized protein YegL
MFNSATQTIPLTDLATFQEPTLRASGSTSLGAALRELEFCIVRDVRPSTPEAKGDYKPVVFLLTDGQPTDEWESAIPPLKARHLNIIALAAGPGADEAMLRKLTETVIRMTDLRPEQLAQFFKWVSASVKVASVRVNGGHAQLPALPSGMNVVS